MMAKWEKLSDGRLARITKGGVTVYKSRDEYDRHARGGFPAPPAIQITELNRNRGVQIKIRHLSADVKRRVLEQLTGNIARAFVELVKQKILPENTELIMWYEGAGGYTGKTAKEVEKWLKHSKQRR